MKNDLKGKQIGKHQLGYKWSNNNYTIITISFTLIRAFAVKCCRSTLKDAGYSNM